VRRSPARRAQQYAAKVRWGRANPLRKLAHEGKVFFLHRAAAPPTLRALETLNRELLAA
jgi:hypothetical protein